MINSTLELSAVGKENSLIKISGNSEIRQEILGPINIANGVMADYYDGNDVPVVTQPPNATLDYGENYSYTISVSDVDSSLSYSLISNLSWLGISGNVISGTASSPGTSTVTIRVSDGTVNVDKSFTITVNQDDAIST